MPTTEFLLHKNKEYSEQFKEKIYQKIKSDFGIQLTSIAEEQKNEISSRHLIAEAVSLIRDRVKNGRLLLNRNIEYGFIRNLIGGSVIAVVVSLISLLIFSFFDKNIVAMLVSSLFIFLYAVPILFSKTLIKKHGDRYARTLFQEYITR